MKFEFRLADIGEGLEEAEIINWLVQVGDVVARDQPIIEIMTDKSNAELPAPTAGVVTELAGSIGDIVTVGDLIAVIDAQGNQTENMPVAGGAPDAPAEPLVRTEPAFPAEPDLPPVAPRPKASPSTRRAAAELGVDLASVTGTGPGGRILLGDLTQPAPAPVAADTPRPGISPAPAVAPAAVSPSTAPSITEPSTTEPTATEPTLLTPTLPRIPTEPAGGVEPLRGIRRAVAQNMTQSWSEIPHIHAFDHIDAEPLLEMRSRLRATERPAYHALTPLSFFVAAVAQALRTFPTANASLDMANQTITSHPNVNVGIAVASEQGLVVPVLRGADQLDFETLSLTLSQLIRGAREGTLSREHFLGGTVTITNFGSLGGEQAVPLIRPPESMIIGFGSIKARPFVRNDAVVACKTMHLVAGADHRLLDGDVTTAVLTSIASLLTDPLQLVL